MNQNDYMTHGDDEQAPPDRAAAGAVSTTGVASHDVQDHDSPAQPSHDVEDDDHAAHAEAGGNGRHGDEDASEVPTLVPTTWKQLILPALILLIVGILVAGPLFGAFASRPPTSAPGEQNNTAPGQPTATPAHEGGVPATNTVGSVQVASG